MSEKMAKKIYLAVSIIFFNVFILLLLINLGFSGLMDLREYLRKKNRNPAASYSFKPDNPELKKVYPGMSQPEISKVIRENLSITQGYEPYVQFKERPFKGKFMNADPRGFRSIDGEEKWPIDSHSFNIFVFGGSTAFGAAVPDNETIAGYLKQGLREISNKPLAVYNFGRCSYMSIQERILLEQLIMSGNIPNLVIFIDGLNDFAHYKGVPAFTEDLTKFMNEGEKQGYQKLMEALPVTKFFLGPGAPKSEKQAADSAGTISDVLSRYKTNKKITEAVCNEFEIKTLFVWQPTPTYNYDQSYTIFQKFDYDDFLPYVGPGYKAAAKEYHSGAFGSNFLWLGDMQENLREPLYVDAIHYSARMSNLIAKRIAVDLSEKKIIQ
jgi:hypothetical protein